MKRLDGVYALGVKERLFERSRLTIYVQMHVHICVPAHFVAWGITRLDIACWEIQYVHAATLVLYHFRGERGRNS